MLYYIILIILVVILVIYFKKIKIEKYHNYIFRIPYDKKIKYKDCLQNCDRGSCLKLYNKALLYDNCKKCREKGMCFSRELIHGVCNPCMKGEKPINCESIYQFGCKNPYNLEDIDGVRPYYIMVDANAVNYAYDTKCKFCWNL